MTAFVVLAMLVCNVVDGQPGDDCETLEISARSCAEAAAWARGWIPPGYVVALAQCTEQRQASR
jgi:hypothetical protein